MVTIMWHSLIFLPSPPLFVYLYSCEKYFIRKYGEFSSPRPRSSTKLDNWVVSISSLGVRTVSDPEFNTVPNHFNQTPVIKINLPPMLRNWFIPSVNNSIYTFSVCLKFIFIIYAFTYFFSVFVVLCRHTQALYCLRASLFMCTEYKISKASFLAYSRLLASSIFHTVGAILSSVTPVWLVLSGATATDIRQTALYFLCI